MADEQIQETEQIIEEATPETKEEIKEEDKEQEIKEPKTREGLISKIGSMIRGHKSGGGETDKEEQGEVIPNEFAKAAKTLNWTDEEIEEFASDFSDKDLIEMIPFLIGEDSGESEENSDKETKEKVPETTDKKGENSQDDEKVKKLEERLAALEKAQGKSKEEQEAKHTADLVHRASQFFDKKSEEFEIFGKTQTLPKFPDGRVVPNSPQIKARQEIWDLACRLNSTGIDWDESLELSFNSYKGKNLANDVKRNYIKDLKKNEQRLTGKPTRHEASSNVVERGADVVREVARKHGREIL